MERMVWNDDEEFELKLTRLTDTIDRLYEKGHKISLVGASAGAGAVINAFAARKDKVSGVVLIAGWVNFPESIGAGYRRTNPAFVESSYRVQKSLDTLDFDVDRTRIQSRYAVFDESVSRRHSETIGAHNKTVPSLGHAITIATQLLFGAPFWIRFLEKQPQMSA
jgi:pimeloyl-ACP methyl ester carboxylesterase